MDESHHQPPNITKDEWRDSMKKKINVHVDDAPVPNRSWRISKPPEALLEVKPKAYSPKVVTIGPLYHNLEPSPFHNYKAQCVKKFMEKHEIAAVDNLMESLTAHQTHDELRDIYNLNIPQSDIEWLKLVLTIDTVFIYEFLLFPRNEKSYFRSFFDTNGITLYRRLERDLLLMGNQIPMLFLRNIVAIANDPKFSLADLEIAVVYLTVGRNPFFSGKVTQSEFQNILESKSIKLIDTCKHLLDCLYVSCIVEIASTGQSNTAESTRQSNSEESRRQSNSEESTRKSVYLSFSFLRELWACKKTEKQEPAEKGYVSLPTASKLYRAGIRFKACEGNITAMKYDKSKFQLHLPRVIVFDGTEDVLRNILAYEITSTGPGEFSMYAEIMDSLINTEEDLAILTKAKVIENHTGSDSRVVQMWNDMGTNVPYNNKSKKWEQMIDDIVAHHSSRWHRLYAEFYEKFFSRPWLTTSLIVAFLLLSATIYQAAYSGIAYYKPKNP